MTLPAIELDGTSKYYKLYTSPKDRLKEALHPFKKQYHEKFYALKDFTLSVRSGEIVGIVGKNGSGKSTLLKIISGVLPPSSGTASVQGSISAILELASGFNPEYTGIQNIYFYGSVLGFSKKSMDSRIDDIINFAEIGPFMDQPFKNYSSGMKARLGFAVAVHIDPEILILDEVLAVGDELFKRKCYAKMEEFFKGGKTILYVSHAVDTINQLCSRAIFIDNGQKLLDGDAKTVTAYYQKYLFAKGENALKVREEIAEIARSSSSRPVEPDSSKHAEKQLLSAKAPGSTHFIPDFVPKTTVEVRNSAVDIIDASLTDAKGKTVNVLSFRQPYTFTARVSFEIATRNVCFGFEIKDERGVKVASVESFKLMEQGIVVHPEKGDVIDVRFHFPCIFRHGNYYMNFGVSSFDGAQVVLCRKIDILVMKVQNTEGFSGGPVNIIDCMEISSKNSHRKVQLLPGSE